jgi:hypothetical protein
MPEGLPGDKAGLSYEGYHFNAFNEQTKELAVDGISRQYEDMLNDQYYSIPTVKKPDKIRQLWDLLQEDYYNGARGLDEHEIEVKKKQRIAKKKQIISNLLYDMNIIYRSFNTDLDKAVRWKSHRGGI